MNTLSQYNDKVTNLFSGYLRNKLTLDVLIEKLRKVEAFHREYVEAKRKQMLWFRFDRNDTSATTIDDIFQDLKDVEGQNFEHMRNNLQIACDKKELEIYYS